VHHHHQQFNNQYTLNIKYKKNHLVLASMLRVDLKKKTRKQDNPEVMNANERNRNSWVELGAVGVEFRPTNNGKAVGIIMQQPTAKVSKEEEYEKLFRIFLACCTPATEEIPPDGVITEQTIVIMLKEYGLYNAAISSNMTKLWKIIKKHSGSTDIKENVLPRKCFINLATNAEEHSQGQIVACDTILKWLATECQNQVIDEAKKRELRAAQRRRELMWRELTECNIDKVFYVIGFIFIFIFIISFTIMFISFWVMVINYSVWDGQMTTAGINYTLYGSEADAWCRGNLSRGYGTFDFKSCTIARAAGLKAEKIGCKVIEVETGNNLEYHFEGDESIRWKLKSNYENLKDDLNSTGVNNSYNGQCRAELIHAIYEQYGNNCRYGYGISSKSECLEAAKSLGYQNYKVGIQVKLESIESEAQCMIAAKEICTSNISHMHHSMCFVGGFFGYTSTTRHDCPSSGTIKSRSECEAAAKEQGYTYIITDTNNTANSTTAKCSYSRVNKHLTYNHNSTDMKCDLNHVCFCKTSKKSRICTKESPCACRVASNNHTNYFLKSKGKCNINIRNRSECTQAGKELFGFTQESYFNPFRPPSSKPFYCKYQNTYRTLFSHIEGPSSQNVYWGQYVSTNPCNRENPCLCRKNPNTKHGPSFIAKTYSGHKYNNNRYFSTSCEFDLISGVPYGCSVDITRRLIFYNDVIHSRKHLYKNCETCLCKSNNYKYVLATSKPQCVNTETVENFATFYRNSIDLAIAWLVGVVLTTVCTHIPIYRDRSNRRTYKTAWGVLPNIWIWVLLFVIIHSVALNEPSSYIADWLQGHDLCCNRCKTLLILGNYSLIFMFWYYVTIGVTIFCLLLYLCVRLYCNRRR
jgi:hypothetical protein